MQIVFLGDNLYEISNPIFCKNILGRKRKAGYIVYATNNKYTWYWRASQCCTTQVGVLSEGFIFFS